MEYRINYIYPIAVWFLTILTAPLIIGLSLMTEISMGGIDDTISFIGLGIAISAGLSLPTLFVYYFVFLFVSRSSMSATKQKLLLATIAMTGFITTFQVIGLDIMEFTFRDVVLPLSYILGILFFSFLFRIRKASKAQNPEV